MAKVLSGIGKFVLGGGLLGNALFRPRPKDRFKDTPVAPPITYSNREI